VPYYTMHGPLNIKYCTKHNQVIGYILRIIWSVTNGCRRIYLQCSLRVLIPDFEAGRVGQDEASGTAIHGPRAFCRWFLVAGESVASFYEQK